MIRGMGLSLGARPTGEGRVVFRVWAPCVEVVEVVLKTPHERRLRLDPEADGYHATAVEEVPPECDYVYRLDDEVERPDPASRWQPQGVHGPSRVVSDSYEWSDERWRGRSLREAVIYELHVGTFTAEGTLDAAATHLGELRDLGITVVELMPVAQFPGARNWGYDGVYPFAVQDSYGGPAALKSFVDAAHEAGLGVVLDVVYNHLGPEGNYLSAYGPYFTDRYRTPWGDALNFDGPDSDPVRRYFLENALTWQTEFHLDGLRLDAVHAIRDLSAVPFLEELGEVTHQEAERLKRPFHLIAESDMNMARHILPRTLGGYGLDAQWSDDFHHALHVLMTGERSGYYADYRGMEPLGRAWREGYAYTGQFSPYRRHRYGSSPRQNPAKQFVVCTQNHDQVGNRMLGDRLSASLSFEQQRCAAAATLLCPMVPLLFMGEEYGETAPFQYFVSHGDAALVEAVRRGRREEFAAFAWQGEVSDPQNDATFQRSKLNHELVKQTDHRQLYGFYRECLRVRREIPALAWVEKETQEVVVWELERVLAARCWTIDSEVIVLLHFGTTSRDFRLPTAAGVWRPALDSTAARWGGVGGSQRAEQWEADSGMTLTLEPWSALVLERIGKEGR